MRRALIKLSVLMLAPLIAALAIDATVGQRLALADPQSQSLLRIDGSLSRNAESQPRREQVDDH